MSDVVHDAGPALGSDGLDLHQRVGKERPRAADNDPARLVAGYFFGQRAKVDLARIGARARNLHDLEPPRAGISRLAIRAVPAESAGQHHDSLARLGCAEEEERVRERARGHPVLHVGSAEEATCELDEDCLDPVEVGESALAPFTYPTAAGPPVPSAPRSSWPAPADSGGFAKRPGRGWRRARTRGWRRLQQSPHRRRALNRQQQAHPLPARVRRDCSRMAA